MSKCGRQSMVWCCILPQCILSNQNQSLHSIRMRRVSDVNWQLCQLIHYVIDHKLPHICMNVTHGARNYR